MLPLDGLVAGSRSPGAPPESSSDRWIASGSAHALGAAGHWCTRPSLTVRHPLRGFLCCLTLQAPLLSPCFPGGSFSLAGSPP